MENNKCIITYGFSKDQNKLIDDISVDGVHFKHNIIEKSMSGMKIKDIIYGNMDNSISKNIPDEKVILFNNLTEEELNSSMQFIKNNIDRSPIFAMVTKTSAEWTFDYLIDHLIKEREWFRKQHQK